MILHPPRHTRTCTRVPYTTLFLSNYFRATGLLKDRDGKISGVTARDEEAGGTHEFHASTVINATGVFVDQVLQMAFPSARPMVAPSRSEEHTSELQSLMRISYADFCLKIKTTNITTNLCTTL